MSNEFYLGRVYDMESRETLDDKLIYDSRDLTTHGVIVGMTGSGKTGLCLDLMEEAALNEVPAIMIDPKGDITNALLHFPDLAPSDFEPWIDPADAQRKGKSVGELAAGTADLWRNGLASWDIGPERIQKLADTVHFSIYTPGSDAGRSISILSSLAAPDIPWAGNEEALRERIGSTVTALLGLIGQNDVDPVTDREHILLANIFEHAWSQGKDLTLGELIMQTQNPPFEKLGFFDVSVMFPDKARFALALQLNNILAAPSFQSWIKGEPFDIQSLLYLPDGKPRHTIFYIAHLTDAERMFFVTLLYGAVESWMRGQSGTGSLRALVYFDEIFGYLPPIGNPPSKKPMLRLLKQARAFGVGMVLATQNPVDIDYKALSNAGTWFIGKLGTDQDKQRLLDGLESAMGAGLSRKTYDRMISNLGKRVFLLRNVHEKEPALFQTRWAMNYLAGPITRSRIGELNALVGADGDLPQATAATTTAAAPARSGAGRASAAKSASPAPAAPEPSLFDELGTLTRPKVPSRVQELFLPVNLTVADSAEKERREWAVDADYLGVLYHPVLIAQADIRINQRKYGLDTNVQRAALVNEPDDRGMVRWEEYVSDNPIDVRSLPRLPEEDARFGELRGVLSQSKLITALKRDFTDWIYRGTEVNVRTNEQLKLFAAEDVDDATFRQQCVDAAQDQMDIEVDKIDARFKKKLDTLKSKLTKEERELEMDRAELQSRRREEGFKAVETVASLFGFGRKRSLSSSMSKRRMTAKAQADVQESEDEIARLEREMTELKDEHEEALAELHDRWMAVVDDVTQIGVRPYKKDILIDLFGVAWLPFHVVDDNGRTLELPAYE